MTGGGGASNFQAGEAVPQPGDDPAKLALASLDPRVLARLDRDLSTLIAKLGVDDRAATQPLSELFAGRSRARRAEKADVAAQQDLPDRAARKTVRRSRRME